MDHSRTLTRPMLGIVIFAMVVFDYREYDRAYQSFHGTWMDVIGGIAGAPQQYRIAVPLVANILRIHCHIPLRAGFAIIDLICATVGLYILLALLYSSRAYRNGTGAARWLGNAIFLFLVQFYFAWIVWYQRPETMASMATLALSLRLLKLPPDFPKLPSRLLTAGGLLILAGIQGFVRADLLVAFHVGVLITCLVPRTTYSFTLDRYSQLAVSAGSAVFSLLIQYYLMHFAYPHAQFGKVFVIRENLTQPLGWIPFCLFMAPWVCLIIFLLRQRMPLDMPDLAVLIGSAIYLVLWAAVGRIEEVRIFMPYAVAVAPLTSGTAMSVLARSTRLPVVNSVR